jgi:pyruvate/2-oxoglutarate dehydrogenase complex dihydrolipoamide acyltransferase (E2) component
MIAKQSNRTPWDLVPNQQEAFLELMSTTFNAYMSFLRIPFSFYQMEVNATEAATQEGKQLAVHVAQQATEAATEQAKELAEQATQQAIEAATQQVKQFAAQAALQVAEAAGTAAQLQQGQAEVWTFEHPLQEAERHRPLLLQVHMPGIVHAGVNQEGKWSRTYDVPLEEVSPGIWQAYVLDPEINEFTFIWYDPDQPGKVQWEGKNYSLPRQDKRA